jgi:peptidoglycan/LPS O-acetylase OafA/YrhL
MRYTASVREARLLEIDGLRGWAALSVLMAHLVFGVFIRDSPPTPVLREVLEPLLGGTLDVAAFYVLSGDALAASFWRSGSHSNIFGCVVKRYVRLSIPIFVSCLVVFLLIKGGFTFNKRAASILSVNDWLGLFITGNYEIADVVKDAGFNVFFNHSPNLALNPFLGTMQVELFGSITVFVFSPSSLVFASYLC